MTGWRHFDPDSESEPGRTLWLHKSGTDRVEFVTCDEHGEWHFDWGGNVYATTWNPDLCHEVVPPALPESDARSP